MLEDSSSAETPTRGNEEWFLFASLPDEMQRSVIQELDFATLSNVICTCKLWSEQSELMWELRMMKVYPNAKKIEGFSWRWIALSKQDILDREKTTIGRVKEGTSIYEGEWKEGRKHGFGIYYYGEGDVYEGYWAEGNHHGKGKYIWDNGDIYEGDWVNDEQTGWGRLTWASGNVYEGDWCNSRKEGQGVHYWCNGDIHKGLYKQNKKHGKGEYIWVNQNRVQGEWVDGERVSGTFCEAISGRTFTTDLVDKPDELHLEFCHPDIVEAVNQEMCTFAKTGENFYFQYLWRLQWDKEESHTTGICLSCYKHCKAGNNIVISKGQVNASWGGNFYCFCGSGKLSRPCRLMHPEVYDVKKLVSSFDKMSLQQNTSNLRNK